VKRSLAELAAHVGGQLEGDGALIIDSLAGLEEARAGQLSFFAHAGYRKAFEATKASAVLVPKGTARHNGSALIAVDNPQLAFARVSQLFFPAAAIAPGLRPGAHVDPSAKVDPSAAVLAGATVETGASVGARVVLHPGAYVGAGARIGEGSVLHPNVTVYAGCVVGARCVLHAGSVVGADGFGFALDASVPAHVKIPQTGIARLEDDVELGACSCVDRATMGETVIGRGTKIDNLVQVGHNVKVGPLSILCAQVGVSGSSTLGMGVALGGQVGVAGHITLGDGVKAAAQSGIAQDVEAGSTLGGSPATDVGTWKRLSVAVPKLPELMKELRALRKRIEALEQEKTDKTDKENAP
jgi:UDP-3-O-[3-hydroxymyristoyl] glucosamine N-acyltransferase